MIAASEHSPPRQAPGSRQAAEWATPLDDGEGFVVHARGLNAAELLSTARDNPPSLAHDPTKELRRSDSGREGLLA